MIAYSPAKINIGLNILDKRPDGYHNIHSYFYPVPLYDLIEIRPSTKDQLVQTGFIATSNMEDNLVIKTLVLLREKYNIPSLKIHLHKQIPFQAGLGGGSGNVITLIKLILEKFNFRLTEPEWLRIAEAMGSDCPFFIHAKPSEIKGRGEKVNLIDWTLKGLKILIVKPPLSISTKNAFSKVENQNKTLNNIAAYPIHDYQKVFHNQFESLIVSEHPEIGKIKNKLMQSGALYASLSGSGSAVFGLFRTAVKIKFDSSYFVWSGELQ